MRKLYSSVTVLWPTFWKKGCLDLLMQASTIFRVKWHISLLCLDMPVFISAAVSSSLVRSPQSSCQRAKARSRAGAVKGMMDMMSAVMVTLLRAAYCALARKATGRRGLAERTETDRLVQPAARGKRRRRKKKKNQEKGVAYRQ